MSELTVPGDVTLYYEDSGGEGQPVVLIHGWPLSADAWESNVGPLAAAGYRVIAYDRRGFGRSTKPDSGYDYDTLTADLASLIEQLDLRDVVLVGFSMGGGEVARYLGKHDTSRLGGAVLAAAITPCLEVKADNPDGGMPKSGFEEMQAACRADRDSFLDGFITSFFSTPKSGLRVTEDQRQAALAIAAQGKLDALVETIVIWADDFRDDLAGCEVPLLVIHGDGDQNVPFAVSGARVGDYVPTAQLDVISDGPHGINVSDADQFNRLLIAFLDSLSEQER